MRLAPSPPDCVSIVGVMTSQRLLIGGCLWVIGLAAPAAASTPTLRATAAASATIVGPAGLQVITPLLMPSVTVAPSGVATFSGDDPSLGDTPAVAGNARLIIQGDSQGVLSLDVPPTITVTRAGGDEALTVRTSVSPEYSVAGSGVVMGGSLIDGAATSVDISGRLSLASSQQLVPGPYAGLMAVVVDFN